jgi:dTDP-4-dehydrorhamnose reductase
MRLLVTGAAGQLAGAMLQEFRDAATILPVSRQDLDIADFDAVRRLTQEWRPSVIVNCAAYNDVDGAEDQPEAALTANAFGVRVLARAAQESGARLVHFSTDFVFDGRASRPYTEADPPNPLSVYGSSKLLGEWFAACAPNALVLRVESLFGGVRAKSSIDRIGAAISSGSEVRVFSDRVVSPSFVDDVAHATRMLLDRGESGLFHCVATGYCTWHELGQEIARLLGRERDARLLPVSTDSVRFRAARPKFAALANDKLSRIVPMPTWQDALRRHLT